MRSASLLLCLSLLACFGAPEAGAQTVGIAFVGGRMNAPQFNRAAGAGLWCTLGLAESKWHIGAAGSFYQSQDIYTKQVPLTGANPQAVKYNNRMWSATALFTREIISRNKAGLFIGPAISYSSIGSLRNTHFADRVFAGAWANINYGLSKNLKAELVLHPRFSPKGKGGSTDVYDPFSDRSLSFLECWIGLSYTFGEAE